MKNTIQKLVEKINCKYTYHASNWHDYFCHFPHEDLAVCNCVYSENKKTVGKLTGELLLKIQSETRREINREIGKELEPLGLNKDLLDETMDYQSGFRAGLIEVYKILKNICQK